MKREHNDEVNEKEKKVKYDIKDIIFEIISERKEKRPFYMFISYEFTIENEFYKDFCKIKKERRIPRNQNHVLKRKQILNFQKDIITILETQKEGIWIKIQNDDIINLI